MVNDVSLRADGKGQMLSSTDFEAGWGVDNEWTLSFWIKPFDNKETSTVCELSSLRGNNLIRVTLDPISSGRNLLPRLKTRSSMVTMIKGFDGTIIKHAKYGDFVQDDAWVNGAITWDGEDFQVYASGIAVGSGVTFVDSSGTMSDGDTRKFFYGGTVSGTVATSSGHLGHLGLWNTALPQVEVQEIASQGFTMDLTSNSGNYVSSASLKAYYKPGENSNDLGADYSGNSHNLDRISNLTAGEVITDAP